MPIGKKHSKKKILALTSVLETATVYGDVAKFDLMVNTAEQLRDLLIMEGVSLSRADKVQLLKAFTKVKVRAFMAGTDESYRTFRTLESIGSDLVKLL